MTWDDVEDVTLVLTAAALALLLDGCGVSCVNDLRRVAETPVPQFAIVERCEREVCRTPLRLPASATITGSCER